MKKNPGWLINGMIIGGIGTIIFYLIPSLSLNYSLTPWYAKWFVGIASSIFVIFCIIFNVDFISDAETKTDHILAAIFNHLSVFLTFFLLFMIAIIVSKIAKLINNKKI